MTDREPVAGRALHTCGRSARPGHRVPAAAALVVGLVAALAAGCDAAGPSPTPHQTATTPAATRSGPVDPHPMVVDALAEWGTLAGPSEELLSTGDFRPDVFATSLRMTDGGEAVAIFRDGVRAERPLGAGVVAQDKFLVGDSIVYGAADEDGREFYVYRWDGKTKNPETLIESTGKDWWWSETAVVGSFLYYVTSRSERTCIDRIDLSQSNSREHVTQVYCVGAGRHIFWLRAQDSVLSFLNIGPDDNYGVLYRVTRPGRAPEPVEGAKRVSRGIAGADLAVWAEPPVPDAGGVENWFDVPILALVDGTVVELGHGASGSHIICDGVAYWTKEEAFKPDEIRRWRPGGPIEVIYRSPDDPDDPDHVYVTSSPSCFHGTVAIQRSGAWPGSGDEFLTTPPLGWTADMKPAAPRPTD